MKIEIEIPDYVDKKLLNEELITEMKISAYIPLIENGEMSESGVAAALGHISRCITRNYFEKIGYIGHLKDYWDDFDDEPKLKERMERNRKMHSEYLHNKVKNKKVK